MYFEDEVHFRLQLHRPDLVMAFRRAVLPQIELHRAGKQHKGLLIQPPSVILASGTVTRELVEGATSHCRTGNMRVS